MTTGELIGTIIGVIIIISIFVVGMFFLLNPNKDKNEQELSSK